MCHYVHNPHIFHNRFKISHIVNIKRMFCIHGIVLLTILFVKKTDFQYCLSTVLTIFGVCLQIPFIVFQILAIILVWLYQSLGNPKVSYNYLLKSWNTIGIKTYCPAPNSSEHIICWFSFLLNVVLQNEHWYIMT